jgi:hypothetical protein
LPQLKKPGTFQSFREHGNTRLAGWWYTYPSEKYEFVSWDYHSQHMEKSKIFQTTNQQVYQ